MFITQIEPVHCYPNVKLEIMNFESDYLHRPHILAIQSFQSKYLGKNMGAFSLHICLASLKRYTSHDVITLHHHQKIWI